MIDKLGKTNAVTIPDITNANIELYDVGDIPIAEHLDKLQTELRVNKNNDD